MVQTLVLCNSSYPCHPLPAFQTNSDLPSGASPSHPLVPVCNCIILLDALHTLPAFHILHTCVYCVLQKLSTHAAQILVHSVITFCNARHGALNIEYYFAKKNLPCICLTMYCSVGVHTCFGRKPSKNVLKNRFRCNTLRCRCEGGGVQCRSVFVTELCLLQSLLQSCVCYRVCYRVGRRRKCRRNAVRNHRILSFHFWFGFQSTIFHFISSQLLWEFILFTAICCTSTVQCICTAPVPVLICSVAHCRGFSRSTFITRSAFNSYPQPVSSLYFSNHWITF